MAAGRRDRRGSRPPWPGALIDGDGDGHGGGRCVGGRGGVLAGRGLGLGDVDRHDGARVNADWSGAVRRSPSGTVSGKPATQETGSRHADPFPAAEGYLAGRTGTVLAAVYDVQTGQSWRLGDGPAQDEASVVKLNILEALLNQGDGDGLPAGDQGLAQQMIEDSDNDAATDLWYAAGGEPGLSAYDAKAGLTATTPSPCVACAGFPWPGWGLTTTVPHDQITLLKQLITAEPAADLGRAQLRAVAAGERDARPGVGGQRRRPRRA